jgi:DNA modification methylase
VNYTLYHGDCLVEMDRIPDGSIDMILADLPYGTTQCHWDSIIPLDALWAHYTRVIKKNGIVALFAQTPFDKVLGCSNLKWLKYEWIWEKTDATGFYNARKAPMKAHENILIFYQSPPTYNPIKTTGHPPVHSFIKRIDVQNRTEVYGKSRVEISGGGSTERYPRDVIKFSTDKQRAKFHPTQKPVSVCEYLIRTYTNAGETVLDNTMGSGSIGEACAVTGRNFIGIELYPLLDRPIDKKTNPNYFFDASDRIGSAYGKYQYPIEKNDGAE